MILKLRDIAKNLLFTPANGSPGCAIWVASKSEKFNVAHTWRYLKLKKDKVPWHNLVWFSLNVPKFSFISRLAVLDKLSTLLRMIS